MWCFITCQILTLPQTWDNADALRLFKFVDDRPFPLRFCVTFCIRFFKATEGAGGVGGFITGLFFVGILLFGAALLAFYGFAIYKNGAIMDVIWRLCVNAPLILLRVLST